MAGFFTMYYGWARAPDPRVMGKRKDEAGRGGGLPHRHTHTHTQVHVHHMHRSAILQKCIRKTCTRGWGRGSREKGDGMGWMVGVREK